MSFFGSIIGFIKNVLTLIKYLFEVIGNPPRGLSKLFAYVFGLALYIAYVISLPFVKVILPVVAYAVLLALAVAQSLLWLLLFVGTTALVVVLWLVDIPTQGAVMRLMRCENEPDAWMTTPSHAAGNRFVRAGLCWWPCGARFVPAARSGLASLWARRLPADTPAFCPQQAVCDAATGGGAVLAEDSGPAVMTFAPDAGFWARTEAGKRAVVADFFARKSAHISACMRGFDARKTAMAMNVCANLDTFVGDPAARARARAMCAEAFCDYVLDAATGSLRPRTAGERAGFCDAAPPAPELPAAAPWDAAEAIVSTAVGIVVVVGAVLVVRRAIGVTATAA